MSGGGSTCGLQYKWTALTVTMVGTLMSGIDGRILSIGLPTIALQLHAGADELAWMTQAYSFTLTLVMLFVGRISDVFGRVRLYNWGFVIFTVGSALCALSMGPYQLIASRMVQGVGGGILLTNSSTIVTDASPTSELGTMLGLNQASFRAGNVSGLVLAGVILSIVDWRGLFFVNIPIGIYGTIWAHSRLRETAKGDVARGIDWIGVLLFSTGLASLLLGVTFLSYGLSGYLEGGALLFAGLGLLMAFVVVERKKSSPLLDLALFKIREFGAGNIAQILNSLGWTGSILLMSFYLQIGLGYTPLQAGLGILPLDGTYMIFTFVGGKLSDRYGSRILTTVGLLVNSVGLLTISTLGAETPYPEVAAVLAAIGVGNGLFTSPNLRAIMGSVPVHRRGSASAFRNTMFSVGSTVSFGLVVLFITFGIPYGTFSALLQGALAPSAIPLGRSEFLNGFRIATLLFGAIIAVGIIPSALRGGRQESSRESPSPEGSQSHPSL
jgi:EmrB/QacA subfamily drug resistance transporter